MRFLTSCIVTIMLLGCHEPHFKTHEEEAPSPITMALPQGPTTTPVFIPPQDAPAPRLIGPLSTSLVNTTMARFSFEHAPQTTSSRIELCADRACAQVWASKDTAETKIWLYPDVPGNITPIVIYWRVTALNADGTLGGVSATWQFYARPGGRDMQRTWGSVPDFNGDGHAELLVGEKGQGNAQDQVHVFSYDPTHNEVRPQAILFANDEAPAESFFGASITSAGDVNGDGFADAVVGAPCSLEQCTPRAARVYLFHGGPNGLSSTPSHVLHPPSETLYQDFGVALSTAHDINQDGYADVVVGAPDRELLGEGGRVYVYLGSAQGLGETPNITIFPPEPHRNFGVSLAAGFDWSGDGYKDVVIGAPKRDSASQSQSFVYIYEGNIYEGEGIDTSAPALKLSSDTDSYGEELAYLYSSNIMDIVVASPSALRRQGSVSIYNSDLPIEEPKAVIVGRHDDHLGTSIARVDDRDRDGRDELLVGVPGRYRDTRPHESDVGAALFFADVYSGDVDTTLHGFTPGERYGAQVSAAFSISGSYTPDVVATGYSSDGSPAVRLFSGPDITPRRTSVFAGPEGFGNTLAR